MDDPRDWDVEYDGAAPPLPRTMRRKDAEWSKRVQELFPAGAYFLRFVPKIARKKNVDAQWIYAGVLRVHHETNDGTLETSGSGDLYRCERQKRPPRDLAALRLARRDYRYYLRLESLWITGAKRNQRRILLGFDTYRFDLEEDGWEEGGWQRRQAITLHLEVTGEQPLSTTELSEPFTVFNSYETPVGTMRLQRFPTPSLRRAAVKVHHLERYREAAERLRKRPEWGQALEAAGWEVDVALGGVIEEAERWTRHRLRRYHATVIEKAPPPDVPEPWTYHLLLVDKIRLGGELPRGLMYDVGVPGGRDAPRQGAALAEERMTRKAWKKDGLRGSPPPPDILRVRTALHELGHMQGLYHSPARRGLLQPLMYLEGDWTDSLDLRFSAQDAARLRHLPDLWVAPGGVPFGYRYRASAAEVLDLVPESPELRLTVAPIRIRTGEPGRLEISLQNVSQERLSCPHPFFVAPRHARFGLVLEAPDGRRRELLPVPFPRPLTSDESSVLFPGDELELPLEWQERWILRDAGTHLLHTHLMWLTEEGVAYRASRTSPLSVI